ncbi:MAG: purine-binding chemotaxis protein CheW [Desulfobacteraceae bacterium]|nr:MAG: purine-binding chemotaxis protein CheW [Desulfobacteraceae bacterium]
MSEELETLSEDLYDDGEDTMKDRYFTFRIGNEEYGIEIMYVIEVIGIQKITEVPDMPVFVKGVINLRGQVIPVMDVRVRFGMEEQAYNERTCIVVVTIKDSAIGLVVDMVSDVIDIPEKDVDPPPKISRKPGSRFIKGLGKIDNQVKILLDVQRLLYDEELEQVSSITD